LIIFLLAGITEYLSLRHTHVLATCKKTRHLYWVFLLFVCLFVHFLVQVVGSYSLHILLQCLSQLQDCLFFYTS
jgi:hypothetical protein